VQHLLTLFVGTFSTLLAIINPLEALPIFLKLLEGKDVKVHRRVAARSCIYAAALLFFFLFFWRLHTANIWRVAEHGPYCRGHHTDAYWLRPFFRVFV
jgi:small neutral amino acid transporter SnatA (MarC family)